MTTLLSRIFTRPRTFCADCQEGQGRNCQCRPSRYRSTNGRPRRSEPTQTGFWWAYAALLLAVTALWRACA